jgi:chemotaxis signal transduction protein
MPLPEATAAERIARAEMPGTVNALVFCCSGHTCALPLSSVVEIMRPQPVSIVAGLPGMVRGLAIIRGESLPVIALDQVLVSAAAPVRPRSATRLVVVRTMTKPVALEVDQVLAVRGLPTAVLAETPPLARCAAGGSIEAIATLDSGVILVLEAGRIVPDEIWAGLEKGA